MGILLLIRLHKLYISVGSRLISKFLSPNLAKKYEKYRVKIAKIGAHRILTIVFICFNHSFLNKYLI